MRRYRFWLVGMRRDVDGPWVPWMDVQDELAALRDQVAMLEAPPVVPEGWRVWPKPDWCLYDLTGNKSATPAALRALAWAIEHDQRPPHAADYKGAP